MSENVFTDEDLKRLKETECADANYRKPTHEELLSLLSRLEAAEFLIKLAQEMLGEKLWDHAAWFRYMEAWRKSCGKSESEVGDVK